MTELIQQEIAKKTARALVTHEKQIDETIKEFCKPKNLRRVIRKLAIKAIAREIDQHLHLNESIKSLKAR